MCILPPKCEPEDGHGSACTRDTGRDLHPAGRVVSPDIVLCAPVHSVWRYLRSRRLGIRQTGPGRVSRRPMGITDRVCGL